MNTINQQTPGPVEVGMRGGHNANGIYARDGGKGKDARYWDGSIATVYGMPQNTSVEEMETLPQYAQGLATARLLAASYTAFDKAGRELGIDASALAKGINLTEMIKEIASVRGLTVEQLADSLNGF